MIDHISFGVHDFEKSLNFYDNTLVHIGMSRLKTFSFNGTDMAGYGVAEDSSGYEFKGKPCFWISAGPDNGEVIGNAKGFHVAFTASSAEAVDIWYEQCLLHGGSDNGAPGPRPYYHPGYYGAFIIDPNGWRIEVAFHEYTGEK